MPSNSRDAGYEHLLRPRETRVVPLICLFDDSLFSGATRHKLDWIKEEELAKAVVTGSSTDASKTVDTISMDKFPQGILPLLLRQLPTWCVWFWDACNPDAAKIVSAVQKLPTRANRSLQHLIFLLVSAGSDHRPLQKGLNALSAAGARVFLLPKDAVLGRDIDFWAMGAAAYVYGGWKRFCETTNSQFQFGPLHVQGGLCVELNFAQCAPDLEYHSRRWAQTLAGDMRQKWLAASVPAEPLRHKALKEIQKPGEVLRLQGVLEFLLPEPRGDKGYLVLPLAQNADGHPIRFRAESFRVNYHEPPHPVEVQSKKTRRALARFLSKVKDSHYFLQLVTLRHTKKWITGNTGGLSDLLLPQMRLHTTLPDSPDSLLQVCSQKLAHCEEYARDLEGSQTDAHRLPSFADGAKSSVRRISAIPNVLGLALRLALISIGLSWLIISPIVWGAITNPFTHPVLSKVSFGALAFLGVLTALAIVYYLYAQFRALRSIEVLQDNSLKLHLADVVSVLIHMVKSTGKKLLARILDWRTSFDKMKRGIETWEPSLAAGANDREPFFSDRCGDVLLTESRRKVLLQAIHDPFCVAIASADWPRFDGEQWKKTLLECAASASHEALAARPILDWITAERPPDHQKKARLESLFVAVKQGHHNAPTLCFLPDEWAQHSGTHDTVQFYALPLPVMLAVSVFPLHDAVLPQPETEDSKRSKPTRE